MGTSTHHIGDTWRRYVLLYWAVWLPLVSGRRRRRHSQQPFGLLRKGVQVFGGLSSRLLHSRRGGKVVSCRSPYFSFNNAFRCLSKIFAFLSPTVVLSTKNDSCRFYPFAHVSSSLWLILSLDTSYTARSCNAPAICSYLRAPSCALPNLQQRFRADPKAGVDSSPTCLLPSRTSSAGHCFEEQPLWPTWHETGYCQRSVEGGVDCRNFGTHCPDRVAVEDHGSG